VQLQRLLEERDQRLAEIKADFEKQAAELRGEMAKTREAMNRLVTIDRAARQERDPLAMRLH
jgi:hypothetical protein